MNRNQAKKFYPIMLAFAEGKAIECRTRIWELNKGWQYSTTWKETEELKFQDTYEYRIKPEVKYRPFKDAEECFAEMQNHQPIGWLKSSEGYYFHIVSIGKTFISGKVDSSDRIVSNSYLCLYNSYTFTDGIPFGVKVKE